MTPLQNPISKAPTRNKHCFTITQELPSFSLQRSDVHKIVWKSMPLGADAFALGDSVARQGNLLSNPSISVPLGKPSRHSQPLSSLGVPRTAEPL